MPETGRIGTRLVVEELGEEKAVNQALEELKKQRKKRFQKETSKEQTARAKIAIVLCLRKYNKSEEARVKVIRVVATKPYESRLGMQGEFFNCYLLLRNLGRWSRGTVLYIVPTS